MSTTKETRRERTPSARSDTTEISSTNEYRGGRESDDSESEIQKPSMLTSEGAMPRSETSTEPPSTELVVSESPGGELIPSSETFNEDLDRSTNLIDSSARDLHGYMKRMFDNESKDIAPPIEKVQTAALCVREICNLMKVKTETLKLYHEITK